MRFFNRYSFNSETLLYEKRKLPVWASIAARLVAVAAFAALFLFYLWIYTGVFGLDLPKTARLKRENAEWQSRIEVLNRQLDSYSETISGIEDRDDDVYRSIFGMNAIPAEIRKSGFGGVNRYDYLDEMGADQALKNAVVKTDVLMKQLSVQSRSLDEVATVSRQAGDMVAHIPAVLPLSPKKGNYRLSSAFGWRSDPINGRQTFHRGMDFAAKTGVKVYATGDGVVESVIYQFGGYGNQVVIDHGFGYKTRYAHLSTAQVAEGMKIRRGDVIGSVGKSGRSTGSHLHYEVIYKGNQVNPYNYLDLAMPVEEYDAMIERRLSESELNKRTTTADILNRTQR